MAAENRNEHPPEAPPIKTGDRPLVLVAGATGYIGARLVPRLLAAGYRVRALARTPAKLAGRSWSEHPLLEVAPGDLLDPATLDDALQGCRDVFYLVHSMAASGRKFAATDRLAAENLREAASRQQVRRIIYLSGLGDEEARLSPHLRSRAEVARLLREGRVPVTVFRAAMVIGSGSASFEILRYLVERLPLMIPPRWVDTPCQPIAIRNVLHYLVACLEVPATIGETFDIGQERIVTYRELMQIYAEEAGLRRRLIVPVPVLTPRLSAHWIRLVTPVPASLALPLAEGLRNEVVCRDHRIRHLLPQDLLDCRQAIRLALDRIREQQVESSWIDAGPIPPAEWATASDPAWAGGTVFEDGRRMILEVGPEECWGAVVKIGGSTGWYYANWLWRTRGFLDRLVGGVGLQRGRRSSVDLRPGDALDFWRVMGLDKPSHLLLLAEMRLPGEALLEFSLAPTEEGGTELRQIARYLPRGLPGLLYWYAVAPFHHFVFTGMMRGIAAASGGRILAGPERLRRP